MSAAYLTIILFFVFMMLGVPVSVSMVLGLIFSLLVFDVYPLASIITLFYSSLDSYLLVAIPLFMLAGISMSYGGIARRLFDFSESILSFLPGSLGAVIIMANMIFGGISGSSVAAVAGLGSVALKEMVTRKYPLKYSIAIIVASSTMAVIIPPSILMIIYASIADTSAGEMLAAGLIPGIIISLLLMVVNTFYAFKYKWYETKKISIKNISRTGVLGLPALLAPVIILGGIFLGTFTPTEASAIAFIYCLGVGFFIYRELNAKGLYSLFYEGGRITGIVALELGSGLLFSNIITIEGIPETLSASISGITTSPWIIMLMLNLVLLIAGMFLNPGFAIIVFTPLLLPLAQSAGYDAVHFGVIMVINLALGLITPPVGGCLYIGSVVSGLKIEQMVKDLLPFYLVLAIALILVILFPQISLGFVEMIYK
ncbi:MAG TPA: TRAP transporter large permease [Cyclobacteriaceae bacterium]|nr:TRAP transporter large permease [Cyclobacteriaceae bacterium]